MSDDSFRIRIQEALRQKGWLPLPDIELALVGSNPLPVYLALKALAPEHAYLLPTAQTRPVAKRIANALKTHVPAVQTATILDPIDSVPRQDEILKRFEAIGEGNPFGLHYTGGTKHMAVHAYYAWRQRMGDTDGSRLHWASYLQVRTLELLLDREGWPFPLFPDVTLLLDELAALHGVEVAAERGPLPASWARARWQTEVLAGSGNGSGSRPGPDRDRMLGKDVSAPASPDDVRLAEPLAGPIWEPFRQALQLDPDATYGDYLCRFIEVTDEGARDFFSLSGKKRQGMWEKAFKWLEGEWLEEWTALVLARVLKNRGFPPSPAILKPGWTLRAPKASQNRTFEVDVVATVGPAAFLVSCTTARQEALIKSKLLEAQVRARQLAGDYAHYAVLTLASKSTCKNVCTQVAPPWEAPNPPKVFHRDQVLDEDGLEKTLTAWLDEAVHG